MDVEVTHSAREFDVVVAGAGPAGLSAGLAMAYNGLSAAIIGPRADSSDGRTSALFQGSIDFLKTSTALELRCLPAAALAKTHRSNA